MKRALTRSFCCVVPLVCIAAAAQESFDATYQLGLQEMQAKQWAAARAAFKKALDATKDRGKKADAELQIGKCFLAAGSERNAMKAFVNSMRWRYYSASAMRWGPPQAALDEYRRILDAPVTRETAETVIFKALAEMGIAQQWRRQRDLSQAEAHYRKALEWLHAPQYSNKRLQRRDLKAAYLGLAETYADRQDYAAARQALNQLLAIPGLRASRDVQQRLWALCRATGGFDALRGRARKTLASPDASPADRVNAQFEIAYSYVYERRYDQAHQGFTKILNMKGATPAQRSEAQLYVAHTLFVARQYAEAKPLYERVVAMAKAAPAHAATARARIKAIDTMLQQKAR